MSGGTQLGAFWTVLSGIPVTRKLNDIVTVLSL